MDVDLSQVFLFVDIIAVVIKLIQFLAAAAAAAVSFSVAVVSLTLVTVLLSVVYYTVSSVDAPPQHLVTSISFTSLIVEPLGSTTISVQRQDGF